MHSHRDYAIGNSQEVAAVVLAAGSGERLGLGPKALVEIGGVPLLLHALRAVCSNEHVARVVVVAPPGREPEFAELARAAGVGLPIDVVAGAGTRQDSAHAGVSALSEQVQWVAVTDAARPFVPPGTVDDLMVQVQTAAADPDHPRQPCGAFPALRIADSLHQVGPHAVVARRIDRSTVQAAQTPQLMRRACLLDAYAIARRRGLSATDEVGLVSDAGGAILATAGDPWNIKITVSRDLALAELMHTVAGADRAAVRLAST
jgi:2-C-methyl-D-erythritol 4-phosphate cytidylyltransferase